jgi:hypothetical protein
VTSTKKITVTTRIVIPAATLLLAKTRLAPRFLAIHAMLAFVSH